MRRLNLRTRAFSLAAVGLLVASCASATPTATPAATPSTEPSRVQPSSDPSTTVYGQLFAQVGDDGSVTKEVALQAFSLAIAPLPGVQIPTGDEPASFQRMDGTFAVRWIGRYEDQLTPEQKAAVDAALTLGPAPTVIEPSEGFVGPGVTAGAPGMVDGALLAAAAATMPTDPGDDLQAYYGAIAKIASAAIAGHLAPRKLTMPIDVYVNTTHQRANEKALAYTDLIATNPAKPFCAITAEPELASDDVVAQRVSIAHEVFHCYQIELYRSLGVDYKSIPDWMIEGQAEWVGEALYGPSHVGLRWWEQYLESPGGSLFGRTYDAVGFYEHLSRLGMETWTILDPMLFATSDQDRFVAAHADQHVFLDSWASGLFRDPNLPAPDWNEPGRWSTDAQSDPALYRIANGDLEAISSNPAATAQVTVRPKADLLQVELTRHSRTMAADFEWIDSPSVLLCTKVGGCECPDGSHYSGPDFATTGEAPVQIGLTGGTSAASGTLMGLEFDPFCVPDEPGSGSTSSGPVCPRGCAMSNGDPHLVTVDGYPYDLQAAGEFVALRAADGSLEVQSRQERYRDSMQTTINTAVAMTVAGHRIGVYFDPEDPEGGLRARLDAADIASGSTIELDGGGRVVAYADGYEIDIPDGTVIWALSVGHYGINLVVSPSEEMERSGTGILGVVAPEGMGLPALPDGTTLPAVSDPHALYEAVYLRFADAWRVTEATSLFEYDPGSSTADLTIPGFPAELDLIAFDVLTAEQRAAGEAACAGVTEPIFHAQCVYDVAVTSDPGFGDSYELTQTLVEVGALPESGTSVRVVNAYAPGNADPGPIDVYGASSDGVKLVATVPYGEVSDWFDPGYVNELSGRRTSTITMYPQGSQDPADQLVQQFETFSGGEHVTFFVGTGPAGAFRSDGSRNAFWNLIFEDSGDYALPEAPAGEALLFVDTRGLENTVDPPFPSASMLASVGDGCLYGIDPGPNEGPQPIGPGVAYPLPLDAGAYRVSIHVYGGVVLGLLDCSNDPVVDDIPLTVATGDRMYLFVFSVPGEAALRTLVVPITP